MPFETEEEAISMVNDTPYDELIIYKPKIQKKLRGCKKIKIGMVDVNGAGHR